LEATLNLLEVAGESVPSLHFHSAELVLRRRYVYPIPIVHVQDGRGGHNGSCLFRAAMEGRCYKHSQPHQSRVLQFNTYLCRPDICIQRCADITHPAFENVVWVSVQVYFGDVAKMHVGQVVLVNIAEYPYGRQVRDGEGS